MTTARRPARARTLALVVGALLGVAACTGSGDPTSPSDGGVESSPSPTAQPLHTSTSAPGAPLTVVGEPTDVEASLRVSRELFDAAGVAVVVPTGQPDVQRLAAHASVAMGVPLLVAPATPASGESAAAAASPTATPTATPAATPTATDAALSDELARLGVRTVVAVGDVTVGGTESSDVEVVRSDATAAALADATGLAVAAPAAADPAGYPAEVAALAPGDTAVPDPAPETQPATAPDGDPSPDLTTVQRDAALADVVALAVDDPAGLAAVATARAAGVPVHLVPATAPNPQATAGVVEALHASTAAHVLALGPALAAQPALEWKIRSASTGYQLPGGGQVLFPRHQFVALYGSPVTSALGLLGEQDAQAAVQRAQSTAAQYAGLTDRAVVPMFEMIATVAAGSAGADGNYSNEQPVDVLRPWVDAAAAAGVYVVLDLQPGRADFLTQAQQYAELLRLPHVGLALDPEWRLGPDERPLQRIGSVGAAEVNSVVQWLADLTRDEGLPPKMFVLHQFRLDMLPDRSAIDMSRPELAMVIHADGQGSQPAKQSTWRTLHRDAPAGVAWGWKNFIDEDLPMLTPEQTVQGVSPVPDLVTYQ